MSVQGVEILNIGVRECIKRNRRSLLHVRDWIANSNQGSTVSRDAVLSRLNYLLSTDEKMEEILCGSNALNIPAMIQSGQSIIFSGHGMRVRNILAAHIAFTVHDEEGKKVAYFGTNIKTGKTKFHSSFNPELYLYRLHTADREKTIFLTTDMFECVRQILAGNQSVCNFGLPYLSSFHMEHLAQFPMLILSWNVSREIQSQAMGTLEIPISFLKRPEK